MLVLDYSLRKTIPSKAIFYQYKRYKIVTTGVIKKQSKSQSLEKRPIKGLEKM